MKKIIRLTENDLESIIEKLLQEQGNMYGTAGTDQSGYRKDDSRNKATVQKVVTPRVETINPKNLKVGDRGEDVIKLQSELIKLGFLKLSKGPTGYFGPITQKALDKYNLSKEQKPQTTSSEKGTLQKSDAAKNLAKCETGTDEVLNPNASLLFDGDKVYWIVNGKTIKKWDAVSGLTWKNTYPGDWGKLLNRYIKNREEWAKQKDAGPLPEGKYDVGPLETRSGQPEEIGALESLWYKITGQAADNESDRQFCKNTIVSRISWGNYRLRITPTGNQKMYGRGDFYLHGGSVRGSHGCIDLTDDMEDFAKFFGVWSSANKKKKIPLTVKYDNPALVQVINKLVNLF